MRFGRGFFFSGGGWRLMPMPCYARGESRYLLWEICSVLSCRARFAYTETDSRSIEIDDDDDDKQEMIYVAIIR